MERNRWFVWLASAFLGLVGCQAAAEPVHFMVFGDPAERDAYAQLVAAFETDHPGQEIELIHVPSPGEYRTRLATEFAAGNPPDISLLNYRRFAPFAESGLLEPLGPYLAQSQVIQPDDFYALPMEAFTWQGELVCLPQNISSLVVYYNQDLFDAAGVPYPGDRWDWQDFLATAQALTRDVDGDGRPEQYGLGMEPSLYRLAPFIWQNRGPLVDDLAQPQQLTLTRFPSLEALTWFTELQTVHRVAPTRLEEEAMDSETRFVAGLTAMYLNSRRVTPAFREITAFQWDVAPLAQGATAANILHSDAYCLAASAADKETAWRFIEFANSPEGQVIIAATGRTVPSLRAVAESDAFLDSSQRPARSQVWLDSIPLLQRVPLMANWEEIEAVADEEIERAFYGEITPLEAAQLAGWRTEEYFFLSQLPAETP